LQRTPAPEVTKSHVKATGYDPQAQVMEIEFHGGNGRPAAVYSYPNISQAQYDALLAAESIGAHLAQFHRGKGERKVE